MTKISMGSTIDITPKLAAKIFSEMTDEEQREFFEEMAIIWKNLDFSWQIHHVRYNGIMSSNASDIMDTFGKR